MCRQTPVVNQAKMTVAIMDCASLKVSILKKLLRLMNIGLFLSKCLKMIGEFLNTSMMLSPRTYGLIYGEITQFLNAKRRENCRRIGTLTKTASYLYLLILVFIRN